MAAIITLAEAKAHLRVTATDGDTDIQFKLNQSIDTIINYLKSQGDPAWTDLTVPREVQSAVLLYLTHLYEHRGDDMKTDEDVWTAIGRLLIRLRDPALA